MVIHFHPLAVWNNSEDNKVDYVLPPGFGKFFFPFSSQNINELFFSQKLTAARTGSACTAKTTPVSTSTSAMNTRRRTTTSRMQLRAPSKSTFPLQSICHLKESLFYCTSSRRECVDIQAWWASVAPSPSLSDVPPHDTITSTKVERPLKPNY